jgi:hypothetical protein
LKTGSRCRTQRINEWTDGEKDETERRGKGRTKEEGWNEGDGMKGWNEERQESQYLTKTR